MKLKISPHLSLPLGFLSLRKVVFGGSGSGKTAFGLVLFEEATAAGVLCGAVDLKGDWWGRILTPLLAAYPQALPVEVLAEKAGYAVGAGAFNNPKGRLRSLGLVEYPQPGYVVAKRLLFLEQ